MPLRTFTPVLRLHWHRAMVAMILPPRQRGPDQLAIRKVFLLGRLGCRNGIHDFLHKWRYLRYTLSRDKFASRPWVCKRRREILTTVPQEYSCDNPSQVEDSCPSDCNMPKLAHYISSAASPAGVAWHLDP